jgi:hypothetical protein
MLDQYENSVAVGEPDLDWNEDAKCAECGYFCYSGEYERDGKTYCECCFEDLQKEEISDGN